MTINYLFNKLFIFTIINCNIENDHQYCCHYNNYNSLVDSQ